LSSFRVAGDGVYERLHPPLGRDDEQEVHHPFAVGDCFAVPVAAELAGQMVECLCAAVPLEVALDRAGGGLDDEAAIGDWRFVR
jgi:hypothetical protein